jgi:hypothetical protein
MLTFSSLCGYSDRNQSMTYLRLVFDLTGLINNLTNSILMIDNHFYTVDDDLFLDA